MQKITLIGNLCKDPEKRAAKDGTTVCSFTVAVNRRFHKEGDAPDYFRVNAWGKLGDNCAAYLAKGRKVAVIGELQARTYDASDGSTRLSLDVRADEVEFLTPKGADEKPVDISLFAEIPAADIPF